MTSTTINGVTNTSPSFQFVAGGIGSSGCNNAGGFFCYDNTAIPPTPASPLITGLFGLGLLARRQRRR